MMVGGLGKSLRQPVRNRAGFTLVELLVVVVILGLLVGLVGPKLFRRADKAKITTAHAQISDFGVALDLYRLDVGRYPDALEALIEDDGAEGWDGEYLKKKVVPKDPWGNDYIYEVLDGGSDYKLYSKGGPDGQEIRSWE